MLPRYLAQGGGLASPERHTNCVFLHENDIKINRVLILMLEQPQETMCNEGGGSVQHGGFSDE